jgi:hypothetical protein
VTTAAARLPSQIAGVTILTNSVFEPEYEGHGLTATRRRAERMTGCAEELYSIVHAAARDEGSMVITSNILDRKALREQITERAVSR